MWLFPRRFQLLEVRNLRVSSSGWKVVVRMVLSLFLPSLIEGELGEKSKSCLFNLLALRAACSSKSIG